MCAIHKQENGNSFLLADGATCKVFHKLWVGSKEARAAIGAIDRKSARGTKKAPRAAATLRIQFHSGSR